MTITLNPANCRCPPRKKNIQPSLDVPSADRPHPGAGADVARDQSDSNANKPLFVCDSPLDSPPVNAIMALSHHNTARPVDARWQIVRHIACLRIPPNTFEWDGWIERGLAFLNSLQACSADAEREKLAVRVPDIYTAYQLHETPDKLRRGHLEARLLSGQTIVEAATACGLTVGAVETYHALFFDVIGKLGHHIYILQEAVRDKIWQGMTEDDVDVILKRSAFLKGPIMLEILMRYYTSGWKVPTTLEEASREQLKELSLMLSVRTLILSWTLPYKKFGRVALLRYLTKELDALVDRWPADGDTAALTEIVRPDDFALWRQAVEAARTGRGLKPIRKRVGAA